MHLTKTEQAIVCRISFRVQILDRLLLHVFLLLRRNVINIKHAIFIPENNPIAKLKADLKNVTCSSIIS